MPEVQGRDMLCGVLWPRFQGLRVTFLSVLRNYALVLRDNFSSFETVCADIIQFSIAEYPIMSIWADKHARGKWNNKKEQNLLLF